VSHLRDLRRSGVAEVPLLRSYGEGVFGCEALWMSEAFSGNSYLVSTF
jgi:hypothetical protein